MSDRPRSEATGTGGEPVEFLATNAFDYELPPELVAQRPEPGRASRLLLVPKTGNFEHHQFAALPDLLRDGDLLIYNDTKVLRARLFAEKVLDQQALQNAADQPPARVEILLVERIDERIWRALLRPARRFRRGGRLRLRAPGTHSTGAIRPSRAQQPTDSVSSPPEAVVRPPADPSDELFELEFDRSVTPLLESYGSLPLPPYIERPADARDENDYQTVFARRAGAVAAPTAGLHFDSQLLERLARRGIDRAPVTLHVGPGTFRPIATDNALAHAMHSEWYEVPADTAEAITRTRAAGGRVVAVGTTVVRTLEAAARSADDDRHPEQQDVGAVRPGAGRTAIYITPGFSFRVVDALITNFHLPRSTLLLLVSAFVGRERILAAYGEAISRRYRFYSYGDAMLLEAAGR